MGEGQPVIAEGLARLDAEIKETEARLAELRKQRERASLTPEAWAERRLEPSDDRCIRLYVGNGWPSAYLRIYIEPRNRSTTLRKIREFLAANLRQYGEHVRAQCGATWVPVGERLPTDTRDVLMWASVDGVYRAVAGYWVPLDRVWFRYDQADDGAVVCRTVTHWAEIPDPPPT